MQYFSSRVQPVAIAKAYDRAIRIAPCELCAIYALYCLAALFALLIAGCATTHLDSQWSSPDFANNKMSGKLLVVGVSRDDTVRRLYEDEMTAQLASRGLTTTVRSYELIPGPLVLGGNTALLKAARDAGANMILSSVVVAREHVDRVISDPMPRYGMNFDGWYGYYWPYAYVRTEIRSFDRYTVGTSLTDVATGKIMWSARTQTENVDHVDREIKAFASVIVAALVKGGKL
jgi:hypothetical protein